MNKINIANKLTILRMLMVPVFVIIFNKYKIDSFLPAIIFSLAAFTDFLDGYLARSKNLVTTFGKFMDPLVDKILTQSGFILLAGAGLIPSWTVIVIIFRELFIDGLRMLAAKDNITIAASIYGKIKTISQFICIILYLLSGKFIFITQNILSISLYVAVILTVISGLDYLVKNIKVLDLKNM